MQKKIQNILLWAMLSWTIFKTGSAKIIELLLKHGANWDSKIKFRDDKFLKVERKYPYKRKKLISKEFAVFLKEKGWRG